MDNILDDIRVLDLTHVWFGPWCTMMLAEMGADVIKVEPPWGALGRISEFGPMYGGASPSFHHLNLGKRDMVLNLKNPKGIELFKELVKVSDIVISNYTPGTMEKMGLGYEALRKIKPDIIYATLSGFGDSGPYKKWPSYAVIAEAISGYARQQGDRVDPSGPPLNMVGFFGDLAPGTMAAMAILAALRHRDKTGVGQAIDVAQFDCMFAYNIDTTTYWLSGKNEAERRVEEEAQKKQSGDPLSIGGLIKVKDGWIMVASQRAKGIDVLKARMGVEEVTKESLLKYIEGMTRDEAVKLFVEIGLPVAPVYYSSESTTDPQILARDMVTEVDHPTLGRIKAVNFPIKFSETPGKVTSAAPILGQHQREIVTQLLGHSEEEFNQLVNDGVLAFQKDVNEQLHRGGGGVS